MSERQREIRRSWRCSSPTRTASATVTCTRRVDTPARAAISATDMVQALSPPTTRSTAICPTVS
ncbi:hypothetical protein Maq22A_3p50405 (plasmid) [Methylobacterium aquaticum]|uniref:Uncharacterized protein n=1 Tax=Methylobacterium aquaticum TaxID=270351 RepID=A0A0C6FCC1_9HYPH|nr:hypothetical protein Maq22A_3p50405 [Methylobacterium aquaticum]